MDEIKHLSPEQIKAISIYEKDEVIINAVHKTIVNISLEYDVSIPQINGCLDVVKCELEGQYFNARANNKKG